MEKEQIIKEIIEGILAFKIIPFFGAGMSKPCEAHDWKEIITELKKEFSTSTDNFLSVAQEYENRFGRAKLISRLKEMCKLAKLSTFACVSQV